MSKPQHSAKGGYIAMVAMPNHNLTTIFVRSLDLHVFSCDAHPRTNTTSMLHIRMHLLNTCLIVMSNHRHHYIMQSSKDTMSGLSVGYRNKVIATRLVFPRAEDGDADRE